MASSIVQGLLDDPEYISDAIPGTEEGVLDVDARMLHSDAIDDIDSVVAPVPVNDSEVPAVPPPPAPLEIHGRHSKQFAVSKKLYRSKYIPG